MGENLQQRTIFTLSITEAGEADVTLVKPSFKLVKCQNSDENTHEIVNSAFSENELILPSLFQWKAIFFSVLETFNPKLENRVSYRLFGRFDTNKQKI